MAPISTSAPAPASSSTTDTNTSAGGGKFSFGIGKTPALTGVANTGGAHNGGFSFGSNAAPAPAPAPTPAPSPTPAPAPGPARDHSPDAARASGTAASASGVGGFSINSDGLFGATGAAPASAPATQATSASPLTPAPGPVPVGSSGVAAAAVPAAGAPAAAEPAAGGPASDLGKLAPALAPAPTLVPSVEDAPATAGGGGSGFNFGATVAFSSATNTHGASSVIQTGPSLLVSGVNAGAGAGGGGMPLSTEEAFWRTADEGQVYELISAAKDPARLVEIALSQGSRGAGDRLWGGLLLRYARPSEESAARLASGSAPLSPGAGETALPGGEGEIRFCQALSWLLNLDQIQCVQVLHAFLRCKKATERMGWLVLVML
ncbi:unnamed protein product [Discosporangium mesarthrocarpum]